MSRRIPGRGCFGDSPDAPTVSVRAQSEVLGFVFVFALIVSMIGIVFTTGFAGLQDTRDFERLNNAERALEVFKDNMEDLVHRGSASRATEIKLADASLSFGDSVTINVSEEGGTFNTSHDVRPLVYEAGTDEKVVYTAGTIIRQGDSGSVVVHGSDLLLSDRSDRRTLIPIVKVRQDGPSGISGDTTVLIRTTVSQRDVLFTSSDTVHMWVNISTPRSDAWRDHLSDRSDTTCEPVVDDQVACRVTTDRVFVTRISVDLTLS